MASSSDPIAMPKIPQYKPKVMPQIEIQPDDPDTYMMLVPANINTRLPLLQIGCVVLAIILGIIALSLDELSDGDVTFSNPQNPEIDYDCGWRQFRLSIAGYSEHYDYAGDYCVQDDEVIDEEFCEDSIVNGRIWIFCGILGVFALSGSLPVILSKKYGGKDSLYYGALLLSGSICFCFGSFWWWLNNNCEDVEQYDEEYVEASFDTSPGGSLYLMWAAIGCTIAALAITVLHVSHRFYRPRREIEENTERIQVTHIN